IEDQPEDAPLTFLFICEALDLDPASLRDAIQLQASTGPQTLSQEAAL
ncbi:MAG: hypothetical protein GX589_11315, partial [Deltaproteobacteria bacterium]|nr:hypothetical protein [Deltaproteobacteria bacterium]